MTVYLQVNLFFQLVIDCCEEARTVFEDIPYLSADTQGILQRQMRKEYNEWTWNFMKDTTRGHGS